MSESKWIVDRRPTEADADADMTVLVSFPSSTSGWSLKRYSRVEEGEPWMSPPKPYQPPQPDTSLAASIERYVDQHYSDHDLDDDCSCIQCDRRRIIEAASKWDATEKKTVEFCESFGVDRDPDGVGVRELREKLGRRVRDVWVQWAKRQSSPKPKWLLDWEELDEPMREVDRCIGSALWADFIHEHQELIAERLVVNLFASSGDKPQPTEKQERREWWLRGEGYPLDAFGGEYKLSDDAHIKSYGIHVREVLPGDDEREAWVEELIDLCEMLSSALNEQGVVGKYEARLIANHLAKRGE